MKVHGVIPAVAAPARDGLELGARRPDGMAAESWLLTAVNGGAAILELGKEESFFLFAYGKAHLRPVDGASGRAFVDSVAEWLGLELTEQSGTEPEPRGELDCAWVRLGEGDDLGGGRWTGYKLFLGLGDRSAEVFFRVSAEGTRAQLVEKWSGYRQDLVGILERVLTMSPPRGVAARKVSAPRSDPNVRGFGVRGAFELELPKGWLLAEQPEGHYRLTDPDDEMMIEFSYLRLPLLPKDAPDVVARLRAVIDGSDYRDRASPMVTFEREESSMPGASTVSTRETRSAPRRRRDLLAVGGSSLPTSGFRSSSRAAGGRKMSPSPSVRGKA